jgi:hypothetical protein
MPKLFKLSYPRGIALYQNDFDRLRRDQKIKSARLKRATNLRKCLFTARITSLCHSENMLR